MWKDRNVSWPAVGVSAVFTAAVVGVYAFCVHAVVIPEEDLAVQQRALAAQIQDVAGRRESEAANSAMALMQAAEAMTRTARPDAAVGYPVADASVPPAPAYQPASAQPAYFPTSAPATNDYPNSVRLVLPSPTPCSTAPAPGIVTCNYSYGYAQPEPLYYQTYPQVLTAGFYGYQQHRSVDSRYNQNFIHSPRR
jgi:hypothetical protein